MQDDMNSSLAVGWVQRYLVRILAEAVGEGRQASELREKESLV